MKFINVGLIDVELINVELINVEEQNNKCYYKFYNIGL